MAKRSIQYVCQSCGTAQSKWAGQCPGCNEWNTLSEEAVNDSAPKGLSAGKGRKINFVALKGTSAIPERRKTNMAEFDRVCGGGLVPGSAILIGGDPGIGKSTILLQITSQLSKTIKCAYISGEEAIDQIRLRAERLGLAGADVQLASATNVRDIITTMEKGEMDAVVIDSIQTMFVDNLDSAPGTVSQVRACAAELIRVGKKRGIVVLLVGHVTKEGNIAGPRVLEHMVDTVLYFEGERGHPFRILRAVKNRFGATDEIGVFEMTDMGLAEVTNPSELFLADRKQDVSGSIVYAGMEGSRPVLVEIQALAAPTAYGTPRRSVLGWDSNRLAMVLAVLETRCGCQFGSRDVYLNIAGGLRISEPAADLAVAAALISALNDEPIAKGTVIFGEIALSGEIRAVSQTDKRIKEAEKLGFDRAIIPTQRKKTSKKPEIKTVEIGQLYELLSLTGKKKTEKTTAI